MGIAHIIVQKNQNLNAPDLKLLSFGYPPELPEPKPGQFIQIAHESCPFLVRRSYNIFSFSAENASQKTFSVAYRVVGPATEVLSTLLEKDVVVCQGPLGDGFPTKVPADKDVLVLAEGMGMASLFFLVQTLVFMNKNPQVVLFPDPKTLFVFPKEPLESMDLEVYCERLSKPKWGNLLNKNQWVFAAGSFDFLESIHAFVEKHPVPCYLFLKAPLLCGYGLCLGLCDSNTKRS